MFWFEKRQDLITSSWRGSWLGNPGSCFVMWLHSVCYCVSYDDSIIILGNFFFQRCNLLAGQCYVGIMRQWEKVPKIAGFATKNQFVARALLLFIKPLLASERQCSAEKPMWREIHFAFWLPFTNFHFINFVVVTNHRKSNNIYNVLYYLLTNVCTYVVVFFFRAEVSLYFLAVFQTVHVVKNVNLYLFY